VVSRALQTIAHDIRSRYTLAYAPPDKAGDGRLRRVRVTVEAPGRSGLKVRTRTAYLPGTSQVVQGSEVTR